MPNAPDQIIKLVENFKRNLPAYQGGDYKEEQLKQEFINPFFEALGWDVSNRGGAAPQYRDVIFEDSIKVGGGTRAPDYCYTLSGRKMFFVEAKKPSVKILYDKDAVYQLRRYAWSAQLPLSILTNFETLIIYESRKRPKNEDNPSTERVSYYSYEEYLDKWEDISKIFSKTAVLQGSIEKFIKTVEKKHGTQEVDDEFLIEIEGWRDNIAKNIALRNTNLSIHDLNFAVQVTIDRIIFLRMCEDRGIEPYGQLQEVIKNGNIYKELCKIYKKCDEKYNSGLFHFDQEKNRNTSPDEITLKIDIDDTVLKGIIKNIYYPDSPYEFSVLKPEILGNIYERFLGKIIRLTEGHHAKVEEKPEVKKAGGVYYTPTYIVDYIVENTVGKLCEKKSPKEISSFKILDPACGSGSFLLGAYSYLLKYHLEYYSKQKKPERLEEQIYKGKNDAWVLTIKEKKRILLNNIYGVDIDPQAVEVTKLSLLLKVLEGENKDVFERQQKLWQERALPDLGNNIKCGNSLISPEFVTGDVQLIFEMNEIYSFNPFDWTNEFKNILNNGGFDTIIGNPPYVRSINLKESNPKLWELYRSHYKSASEKEWDIYLIFVEKGIGLLKSNGRLGYILPNKFLNSQVGENLRAIISEGKYLEQLIHFGAFQIFQGATTYTCLLFLNRGGREIANVARYTGPVNISGIDCPLPSLMPSSWNFSEISAINLTSSRWDFSSSGGKILEKIKKWPNLGNIAQIFQGTGTRADKVFLVENRGRDGKFIRIYSYEKEKEYLIEPILLKPVLRGRNINRYQIDEEILNIIVPYEVINNKFTILSQNKITEIASKTYEYLLECKPRLDEREKGRFKGDTWYCYGRPQNMDRFEINEKIVIPDVVNRGTCYLDEKNRWIIDTAYAITLKPNADVNISYLIAILNSPLLTYYLKETGTALRGGYFRMKTAYLNPFPIRTINFSDPADKAHHDKIVGLVTQILNLYKQLSSAKADHEKNVIQRQIDAVDKQIDSMVYELYGLTEDEIKIIEDSVK